MMQDCNVWKKLDWTIWWLGILIILQAADGAYHFLLLLLVLIQLPTLMREWWPAGSVIMCRWYRVFGWGSTFFLEGGSARKAAWGHCAFCNDRFRCNNVMWVRSASSTWRKRSVSWLHAIETVARTPRDANGVPLLGEDMPISVDNYEAIYMWEDPRSGFLLTRFT